MPIEHVRAAMLSRINVHAHGNSGCRPEITQTYVDMLNKGVTPMVCKKGSVGACGDLAPMSQIALLLMGEGQAYYEGELLEGKEAMYRAGIHVPGLQARDGLAAINGSNCITGISCLILARCEQFPETGRNCLCHVARSIKSQSETIQSINCLKFVVFRAVSEVLLP